MKGDSEWEGELVKGRHSWRNVSSVTVTFDGDKCESAAAQRLAVAPSPTGFTALSSQYLDEELLVFVV